MLRALNRNLHLRVLCAAAAAFVFWSVLESVTAHGQSLADVARQNQQQQAAQASSGTSPKVITNVDLPKDPDGNKSTAANGVISPPIAPSPDAASSKSGAQHRMTDRRLEEQHAAEQWRRQIMAQKNRVATLQARADQFRMAVQHANGTAQTEVSPNRYQARQFMQVQMQLNEQRRKLDQMQDAARHAGMHTLVYDP
jgi:hypothetical protein